MLNPNPSNLQQVQQIPQQQQAERLQEQLQPAWQPLVVASLKSGEKPPLKEEGKKNETTA